MDTLSLFQKLSAINFLSPPVKTYLETHLKEEAVPRKTLLLREGQVAQRIYFIKKGFVRAYYYKDMQPYTSWFMGEGEIIISVYSFFSRKPSFESIEVLEDCVLQSLNWDELQRLYQLYPEFNLIGRLLTEQYYIRSEERNIDLQTLTAGQRYQKLIDVYPEVLQKASLGQIASYLGIKQETLSRIRAT